MSTDKALANLRILLRIHDGGDTGRGRVEHRGFELLRFTLNMLVTGYEFVIETE